MSHSMHVLGVVSTWPVTYDWLDFLRWPPLVVIASVSLVVATILFLPAPTPSLAILGGLAASLPVFLWTVPASSDEMGSWLLRSVIAGLIGLVLGGLGGRAISRHRANRRGRASEPGISTLAVGPTVALMAASFLLLFRVPPDLAPVNVALWRAWGATLGLLVGGLLGSASFDPLGSSRTVLRWGAVAFALAGVAAIFVAEAAWKQAAARRTRPPAIT